MFKNEVQKIKSTNTQLINDDGTIKKSQVAVYARVSTMKELQKSSFELQVSTYHKEVTSNPLWEFAGVFADYGKSGTNVTHRKEFNKMMELARLGRIDIILTKSISRFTRDTVSGLKSIHELRDLGVEVKFEKENISTNDTAFDFFLSVYSSVAEEESRINSSNVLWSYKKKMSNGGNTTPRMYGYLIDKFGNFIIDEVQASAVRIIFNHYLDGKSLSEIIKTLHEKGYKTLNGAEYFSVGTLNRILRNEKYAGDMLLQKTTVTKIGTRNSVPNKTKTMYYVTDNHDPIVSKEVFKRTQEMIKQRADKYYKKASNKTELEYANYVYSIIGQKFYKSKINHRNTKHEIKLLEVLDNNRNRILDAKNIYYRQIDIALENAASELVKTIKTIKFDIEYELEYKVNEAGIIIEIESLTREINTLNSDLSSIEKSAITSDAQKQIKASLSQKLNDANEKLLKLKYQMLMRYTYEKNIPLLMSKLRGLKNKEDFDLKEIFNLIIAKDRDDLLLCIHLSNRNIDEIDLSGELDNKPLLNGTFNFIQTRLNIDVKWQIIII